MIDTRKKPAGRKRPTTLAATIALVPFMGAEGLAADYRPTGKVQAETSRDQGTAHLLDTTKGISFTCGTRDGNLEIYINAYNSDNVKRVCKSTCYYKNSKGEYGQLSDKKEIPANASAVPFAQLRDPPTTFNVVNPGMSDCE